MGDSIRERMMKFYSEGDGSITINACQGHFATSQSHINYYIDVTRLKVRVSEAKEAARSLRSKLMNRVTTVDTIVCLDSMEMLGGFLANELEKADIHMNNMHETIYVVHPEENTIHQFMFRENIRPAVEGKQVIVLVDTMTTGETVSKALECIEYYGGIINGVCSIFSTVDIVGNQDVFTLFTEKDLPGYAAYAPNECPFCQKKIPLEAMVNGYGYSKL
jgi:orotate phosphoribosyltransferase